MWKKALIYLIILCFSRAADSWLAKVLFTFLMSLLSYLLPTYFCILSDRTKDHHYSSQSNDGSLLYFENSLPSI